MFRPIFKSLLNSNASTAIRAGLLVFLLVVSFLLMCILGWQAYQSTSQQRLVAQNVLIEYAQLATDEFARRIMADIGYRGYFKNLNEWRKKIETAGLAIDETINPSELCNDSQSGNIARFHFYQSSGKTLFSSKLCGQQAYYDFIRNQLTKFDRSRFKDKPFTFIHTTFGHDPISIVLAQFGKGLYGFVVNRNNLVQRLNDSFNKNSLLPESLAGGKASNQMLTLRMFDHSGEKLLGPVTGKSSLLAARKVLVDEYSGIFENHQITVAIDPKNADQLIIGGLPENNLSIVIATMLITLLVFVVSLVQLRKEHNLNRLRENFVAEVSHELRTPLTQIRMFAEMLMRGRTRNTEEKQHYLGIINRESLRLSHLIDNVLKYSETDPDRRLYLTPQNVAPIIDNVVEEFSPIASEKNVTINLNIETYCLQVEPLTLKRILLNLLDNSVKYGPDDQTIDIRGQLGKGDYSITISDQGPGIPEKQIKSIWQPYYRLQRESDAAIAGTGIGLYLVKQLAEKLDVTVSVKNNSTQGCRFVLQWRLGQCSLDQSGRSSSGEIN